MFGCPKLDRMTELPGVGAGGALGGAMPYPPPTPAPTVCRAPTALPVPAGTRSVVEHVGHLTNCPVWASLADNGVWHTWHGKTIMRKPV